MRIIRVTKDTLRLECSRCQNRYTISKIILNGENEPVKLDRNLTVIDSNDVAISCPRCNELWKLNYIRFGNMGYRVNHRHDTLIKCHCQHTFKKTVVLELDGTPKIQPLTSNGQPIICSNCNCSWIVEPFTRFKYFILYATIKNVEQIISIGQDVDLYVFTITNAHRAFVNSNISSLRIEEVSQAFAEETALKNKDLIIRLIT